MIALKISLEHTANFIVRALLSAAAGASLLLAGCGASMATNSTASEATTPAADSIGERIFLDSRFAQYFAAHMTAVNQPLASGDPVTAQIETTTGNLAGPFAGQAINCRSCHFVTEFQSVSSAGNRIYADFAARSPLPRAMTGFTHTPRNSMQMVDSFTPRSTPLFLHFDGEFASGEDLVRGTMTGRNFGWLPNEQQQAIAHIARVVREDDGSSRLAADRTQNLSYATLFLGTDSRIPSDLLLPSRLRIDVKTASDQQIVDLLASCVTQYMKDLLFQRNQFQSYVGSPYDNFLRINHLPQQVPAGETRAAYNQRLYGALLTLSHPIHISSANGIFQYHAHPYRFGAIELAGLKIFLKSALGTGQHAGNCAACHQAPDFTDFVFHNTGVSQDEYDSVHGLGAFRQLHIPSLSDRNAAFDVYMPASAIHPNARESLRRPAAAGHPNYADLGLWNIYQNPDIPNPQANLASFVCAGSNDCSIDKGHASTIGQFKTPVLRDLEDSAPYFHNGSKVTLKEVVEFYINSSALAQSGLLRNAPAEFAGMSLSQDDVAALVAFLQSLTEDYDDA